MPLKAISFLLFFFLITSMLFPLVSLVDSNVLSLIKCGGGECVKYEENKCVEIYVCTVCGFFDMIDRIIRFILFDLVPPIAAAMIAIGGFMLIYAYVDWRGGGATPEP